MQTQNKTGKRRVHYDVKSFKLSQFLDEFWYDLRTANPKTWNLRGGQVSAFASAFCLIASSIFWLDGDTKKTTVFLGGAALSAAMSALRFLLYGLEKLRKKREKHDDVFRNRY